jgi:protein-S-isoprenylcysteine O-methyltransferase Ste14
MILNIQNHKFHMSNTPDYTKRIGRWLVVCGCAAIVILGLSGLWLDAWLWAYIAVFAACGLYPTLRLSDELAQERFRPPEPGADRVPLKAIRLFGLLHVVVAALDVGRWQLAEVPAPVRAVGLVGMAVSVSLVFRAMIANHFFSPVVRIQRERGHHVVDRGPYAVVRHPGYVGMIAAIPFSGLALGSWIGFAIALAYSLLIVRRVVFEDTFLQSNLDGYRAYAARVRYRLIPGVW